MPFRFGQKHASHTNPEARSNQGSLPFANSTGEGPANSVAILDGLGTLIPWGTKKEDRYGGFLPSTDLGIAARVSGKFLVTVMLGFTNSNESPHTVKINLENGAGFPYLNQQTPDITVPGGGSIQVPYVYTIGGANNLPTALGTNAVIRVRVFASVIGNITAAAESCFIDVQEKA